MNLGTCSPSPAPPPSFILQKCDTYASFIILVQTATASHYFFELFHVDHLPEQSLRMTWEPMMMSMSMMMLLTASLSDVSDLAVFICNVGVGVFTLNSNCRGARTFIGC